MESVTRFRGIVVCPVYPVSTTLSAKLSTLKIDSTAKADVLLTLMLSRVSFELTGGERMSGDAMVNSLRTRPNHKRVERCESAPSHTGLRLQSVQTPTQAAGAGNKWVSSWQICSPIGRRRTRSTHCDDFAALLSGKGAKQSPSVMSDSDEEWAREREETAVAAAAAAEAADGGTVVSSGKIAAKDNPLQAMMRKKKEKEAEHQAKLDKLLGEAPARDSCFHVQPVMRNPRSDRFGEYPRQLRHKFEARCDEKMCLPALYWCHIAVRGQSG
jgi:hypothetical protein